MSLTRHPWATHPFLLHFFFKITPLMLAHLRYCIYSDWPPLLRGWKAVLVFLTIWVFSATVHTGADAEFFNRGGQADGRHICQVTEGHVSARHYTIYIIIWIWPLARWMGGTMAHMAPLTVSSQPFVRFTSFNFWLAALRASPLSAGAPPDHRGGGARAAQPPPGGSAPETFIYSKAVRITDLDKQYISAFQRTLKHVFLEKTPLGMIEL